MEEFTHRTLTKEEKIKIYRNVISMIDHVILSHKFREGYGLCSMILACTPKELIYPFVKGSNALRSLYPEFVDKKPKCPDGLTIFDFWFTKDFDGYIQRKNLICEILSEIER